MRIVFSVITLMVGIVAAFGFESTPDIAEQQLRLARDHAEAKAASDAFYYRSERVATHAIHSVCIECLTLRSAGTIPRHKMITADAPNPEIARSARTTRLRTAQVYSPIKINISIRRVLLAGLITDI